MRRAALLLAAYDAGGFAPRIQRRAPVQRRAAEPPAPLSPVEDCAWDALECDVADMDWRPAQSDLILEAEDASVWVEEKREYAACFVGSGDGDGLGGAASAVPRALRGVYKRSFTSVETFPEGPNRTRFFHAFDAHFPALGSAAWAAVEPNATADYDGRVLDLVGDLLEATAYLHERGLPHLSLNSEFVRVGSDVGDAATRLKVVGVGAGPKLVATRRPFSLPEKWPFNAPETMGGAIIQSNLRALLLMDAWSVGVLVWMLVARATASPFEAAADWKLGLWTDRDAVRTKYEDIFRDFSAFLIDTNAAGRGVLFRHGWLVQVLLGLLRVEPEQRLTVSSAYALYKSARPRRVEVLQKPAAAPPRRANASSEIGRFGEGRQPPRAADARAAGEPFRSLEAMLNIAENGNCKCVLEKRGATPMTPSAKKKGPPDRGGAWGSAVPYGEVVGFRNRADGDRWDVLLPGVVVDPKSPAGLRGVGPNEPLRIARVIGVVLIKGGNHKIAVEVAGHEPDPDAVLSDVRDFIAAYVRSHPTSPNRVRFLEYDSLSGSGLR